LFTNSTGIDMVAVGDSALFNNTANYNTAVGFQAMFNNQNGANNTAVGYNALYKNIKGNYITAIGDSALFNDTASYNTAVGYQALYTNVKGLDNTANGYQALFAVNSATGFGNTATGFTALTGITTGFDNTADGYEAGANQTSGNYNTFIGALGGGNVTIPNASNYMSLGYDAGFGNGTTNWIEIGNSNVQDIVAQVSLTAVSDGRIKDNVQANVPGLNFITRLRPVTYNLNVHRESEIIHHGKADTAMYEGKYDLEKVLQTGFIAQEVEKAAQDVGFDFSGVDKPHSAEGLYGLRYSEFVVPLVKAVQEQQQMIEQLRKMVETQQKEIEELKKK
jgi:trimeric autotransporter adhesin